jgi:hypothetical protein
LRLVLDILLYNLQWGISSKVDERFKTKEGYSVVEKGNIDKDGYNI